MEWSEGMTTPKRLPFFRSTHCIFHVIIILICLPGYLYIGQTHFLLRHYPHHQAPATPSQEKQNQQTLKQK